jgi:hypothetical protein
VSSDPKSLHQSVVIPDLSDGSLTGGVGHVSQPGCSGEMRALGALCILVKDTAEGESSIGGQKLAGPGISDKDSLTSLIPTYPDGLPSDTNIPDNKGDNFFQFRDDGDTLYMGNPGLTEEGELTLPGIFSSHASGQASGIEPGVTISGHESVDPKVVSKEGESQASWTVQIEGESMVEEGGAVWEPDKQGFDRLFPSPKWVLKIKNDVDGCIEDSGLAPI